MNIVLTQSVSPFISRDRNNLGRKKLLLLLVSMCKLMLKSAVSDL